MFDKETLIVLRGEFTRLKNRIGIRRYDLGICCNLTGGWNSYLRQESARLWTILGYDNRYPVAVKGYWCNESAYHGSSDLWGGVQGEARDKFLTHLISHIDNILASQVKSVIK